MQDFEKMGKLAQKPPLSRVFCDGFHGQHLIPEYFHRSARITLQLLANIMSLEALWKHRLSSAWW
jgi:hypothetical protein